MTQSWKPTAAEKRAIRAYAAKHERRKPGGIVLEIGERSDGVTHSSNLLTFGPDMDAGFEASDLSQPLPWSSLDLGVETINGRAVVDFYVYEKRIGEPGELLSNVQAHVELIQYAPRLVSITGTGSPTEIVNVTGAMG